MGEKERGFLVKEVSIKSTVGDDLKLVLYKTMEDIIEYTFSFDEKNIVKIGKFQYDNAWIGFTKDKVFETIKNMKKFGFVYNGEMHLWFDKCIDLKTIMKTLIHEMAHLCPPYYDSYEEEEKKVSQYMAAFLFAYEIGPQILNMIGEDKE